MMALAAVLGYTNAVKFSDHTELMNWLGGLTTMTQD